MKPLSALLPIVALLAATSFVAARALDSVTIAPQVIASGGQASSSASYTLLSTVGQPAIGLSAGSTVSLCSGYWCGAGAGYKAYLPLALRG